MHFCNFKFQKKKLIFFWKIIKYINWYWHRCLAMYNFMCWLAYLWQHRHIVLLDLYLALFVPFFRNDLITRCYTLVNSHSNCVSVLEIALNFLLSRWYALQLFICFTYTHSVDLNFVIGYCIRLTLVLWNCRFSDHSVR